MMTGCKFVTVLNMGRIMRDVVLNDNTLLVGKEVPYIMFPVLAKYDFLIHGFSSRLGGVSGGVYGSMNLGLNRGDDGKNVARNFELICESMGIDDKDLVFTDQVHKANVRVVTSVDKGKGFIYPRDYKEIDAHVTDEVGVPLVVFTADCVPIYLVDVKKRVIGLVHAGWRGTVLKIGKATVGEMSRTYGSHPKDIVAVIGPSIGPECFEVGRDVVDEIVKAYADDECRDIIKRKDEKAYPDKYYVNLWMANYHALRNAGLPDGNITISGMCTACNPDIFFSHRSMGEDRGSMAGFMQLK